MLVPSYTQLSAVSYPPSANLFVAIHDAAAIQVVRGKLHRYLVAGQNANKVLAHFSRHMRQYLMLVLQFHLKHRVRQRLNHYCHHFNRVFFSHALLSSQFPVLSSQFAHPSTENNGAAVSSILRSVLTSNSATQHGSLLDQLRTENWELLSYSVKMTGPSLVTATQCSKCAL